MLEIKTIQYIKAIFLIVLFIPLIKIDIKERLIPNIYPISITLIGFLLLFLMEEEMFLYSVKSSFMSLGFAGLLMVGIRFLMKSGFGMGDVKLLLSLSWLQGVDVFFRTMEITVIISFIFIIFLLATKKIDRNETLPFAPFAALGTIISQCLACI